MFEIANSPFLNGETVTCLDIALSAKDLDRLIRGEPVKVYIYKAKFVITISCPFAVPKMEVKDE